MASPVPCRRRRRLDFEGHVGPTQPVDGRASLGAYSSIRAPLECTICIASMEATAKSAIQSELISSHSVHPLSPDRVVLEWLWHSLQGTSSERTGWTINQ